MSQTTHCDICGEIIKLNDTKFLLGLHEVTEDNSRPLRDSRKKDMQEYLVKWYQDQSRGVLVLELCKTCKKILYHVFNMKKKERIKILKSLENLYAQEPKKKKGWGK